jgi:arylsulfatase A-like enzyme
MRRRQFVRSCAGAVGGAVVAGSGACHGWTRSGRQPNIILFLVDDMGWQDTSVPFHTQATVWNELYRTPNMERLAGSGMRFTDAYSASPVCSPTRVSMMTGKNPARTHVTDWVGHGLYGNSYLRAPDWATDGLQPGDEQTLPEILRGAGYRTIHIGKGHFGGSGTPGADPARLGFDVSIGGSRPGSPDGSYFLPWDSSRYPGLEDYPSGTHINDALTREANGQIDRAVAEGVPFFMNMAHYAVHTPIIGQGDPAYLDEYGDRPDPEDDYAALLQSMDASLGAILDNLEGHGIAEDTLIVFFSDNGGLSNHTRNDTDTYTTPSGTSVRFERDRHNSPLKGGKGSGYEGGVRVPMIVSWAGQSPDSPAYNARLPIEPGTVSMQPVISDDLLPTIISAAGLAEAGELSRELDGVDLSPLLTGDDAAHADRAIYIHYPHQWYRDIGVGLGIQPFTSMRKGDWKLIYFYGDGYRDGQGLDPWFELYDLEQDIGEAVDLAPSRPEIVRYMAQEMHEWMVEVGAQTPVSEATNQPVPLPQVEA